MNSGLVVNVSDGGTANIFIGPEWGPEAEIARGVSPDVLEDTDPSLTGLEDVESRMATVVDPEVPTESDEQPISDERIEELEEIAKRDAKNLHTRSIYLVRLVELLGKARRLEGFVSTTRTKPDDRTIVEDRNYENQKDAEELLKRACDVCPFAGDCAIKGSIGRWTQTHPYAGSDKRLNYERERGYRPKKVEGRMKFLSRLFRNKTAHCMPEKI